MAFACNAVERVVERVGHVRGALVAVARAAGRVRGGGATNAMVQGSHRTARYRRAGGIVCQSMKCSECESQWPQMRDTSRTHPTWQVASSAT